MPFSLTDLTKRLFRRTTKPRRTQLAVTPLEDRVVPANEINLHSITLGAEGWQDGQVTLRRSGDLSQSLSVPVTLSGTATGGGTDYTPSATQFDFAAGSEDATVNFTITNDTDAEPDETIILTLPGTAGGFTVLTTSVTVDLWDNDRPPLVRVEASGDTAEGGSAATFTLTRYSDLQGPASSNYLFTSTTASFTLGGAAIGGGTDYTASATTSVTFGMFQTVAEVTITPQDDSVAEYDESVSLLLEDGTGYTIGSLGYATIIIADNEQPVVMVEKIYDPLEGDSGWFAFSRQGDQSQSLTVNFAVSGTATSGTDFTSLGTSVTFDAGESTAYVEVEALADGLYDPNETVVVTIQSGTGYTIDTQNSATATIANSPPEVTVAKLSDTAEGGSSGTFRFTRTGDTSQTLTVNYTVSGTAVSGSDFTALSGSVTFLANSATADVSVSPIDDSAAEFEETVVVTIADGSGVYAIGTPWTATVNVRDNEQPVVTVERVYDPFEGWTGLFEFKRTGDTSQQLTVNYTVGGTATPGTGTGTDYSTLSGSVVFALNAFVTSLTVQASTDAVFDPDETVEVTIQSAASYVVGAINSAALKIVDNAIPPPLPAQVFDLDVNADGDLGDPVDLAANYLPGYEGNTQKVSTGTSFNADTYTTQRMKLIVDGIGTDTSEVTKVEFVITHTSSHSGYASNRSDPTIQHGLSDDDYSFHLWGDKSSLIIDRSSTEVIDPIVGRIGGMMESTKTWINFYAKDYGGAATVVARIYVRDGAGERVARTLTLKVPKDDDNDGLADKWEIAMAARWSNQYGTSPFTDAQALALFDARPTWWGTIQDDELEDPDGPWPLGLRPLVAQKEKGDAHTVLEEYRGYILDGGGLDGGAANGHPGGHIRLDPARKEILVEVDRGAVVRNIPAGGLAGVLNLASKVFNNGDRGAGISMYYLFDEVALDLPAKKVETRLQREAEAKASRDTAAARTAATPNLKTDFVHFLFVDENFGAGGNGAITSDIADELDKRHSMIAVTDMFFNVEPNGLNSDKFNEFLATTVAHEITHLLFERHDFPLFTFDEHTRDANGNGVPREPEDETCLMYAGTSRPNCELATVRFFPLVQAELKVKSNQALVL
jgi:hypothetical protein